ncbi:hypothetical protein BDR05DRAFT_963176 [Suillus weaverae]|nr:hypothetical protein BDR05DRAFT_963176 [Suillus weaverae]
MRPREQRTQLEEELSSYSAKTCSETKPNAWAASEEGPAWSVLWVQFCHLAYAVTVIGIMPDAGNSVMLIDLKEK